MQNMHDPNPDSPENKKRLADEEANKRAAAPLVIENLKPGTENFKGKDSKEDKEANALDMARARAFAEQHSLIAEADQAKNVINFYKIDNAKTDYADATKGALAFTDQGNNLTSTDSSLQNCERMLEYASIKGYKNITITATSQEALDKLKVAVDKFPGEFNSVKYDIIEKKQKEPSLEEQMAELQKKMADRGGSNPLMPS